MNPSLFAALCALPFLLAHHFIVRGESRHLKMLLWSILAFKLFVAFTMGHYDIYRFIVFLQRFIAAPGQNPWDYQLHHPEADFPYPPLLLGLHAIFLATFRGLLSLSEPYLPTAQGYTLIRIPLLIADLFFLRQLLRGTNRPSPRALVAVALSPVLLFHQYYSGQLDWIAIVPFFFAVRRIDANDLSVATFGWLALSLALKPFALIFLPIWLPIRLMKAWKQNDWAIFKRLSFGTAGALALYKLSELPYLFTPSYRAAVGAGAVQLLSPGPLLSGVALFPWIVLALGFGAWALAARGLTFRLGDVTLAVTLAIASFAPHSAGWMAWLVPFAPALTAPRLWRWWGALFVLRWSLVSHSPLLDSFDVFLHYHLHSSIQFGIGAPYRAISARWGDSTAHLLANGSGVLFALCSALLLMRLLLRFQRPNVLDAPADSFVVAGLRF